MWKVEGRAWKQGRPPGPLYMYTCKHKHKCALPCVEMRYLCVTLSSSLDLRGVHTTPILTTTLHHTHPHNHITPHPSSQPHYTTPILTTTLHHTHPHNHTTPHPSSQPHYTTPILTTTLHPWHMTYDFKRVCVHLVMLLHTFMYNTYTYTHTPTHLVH